MTIFEKKKLKLLDTVLVSDTLKKLGDKPEKGKTKVSEILEDFHENGILLALIFFALPVAIPLPYPPGFTTIMGTPLIILAIQMLLGSKKVKLPQKINDYEIKNSTLKMISLKTVPALIALEKFIKPRGGFAKSVACEQFVGFVSLIGGISVAIPLPLTNAVPALGITVMALGLLNRDLLVIFVGLIIEIIGIFIALGALLASWVAIKYLFNMVF